RREPANGRRAPGERAETRTAWANDSTEGVPLSGTAPLFSGPAGATYMLEDGNADYGVVAAGQAGSGVAAANCYSITVSAPAVRPVPHWDALLQENLSTGVPKTWNLHVGESFVDVPTDNQFYKFVETVFHNGGGAPCDGGIYCP